MVGAAVHRRRPIRTPHTLRWLTSRRASLPWLAVTLSIEGEPSCCSDRLALPSAPPSSACSAGSVARSACKALTGAASPRHGVGPLSLLRTVVARVPPVRHPVACEPNRPRRDGTPRAGPDPEHGQPVSGVVAALAGEGVGRPC